MAPNDKVKKIDITSDDAQKKLDTQGAADKAKEAPDTRDAAKEQATKDAAAEISRSNIGQMAIGKQQVDAETQRYLNEYFQGSIDRFDADKDGKISATEAKEFQAKMMEKTKAIITDVKAAGEKSKEVKQAAAEVKKMDTADVEKSLGEINDISAGGKLELQKGIEEFEKMQKQNTAFQQSVQAQLTSINEFGKSFANFQSKQKGAEFIWSKVKGVFSDSEKNEENELRQRLESTKAAANKLLGELTTKKGTLDKNGESIKAAIAAERTRIIKERDDKLAEIAKAQGEQSEAITEKKKKYKEIDETQKKLEERKKGVEQKQANVAGIQKAWTETKEKEQLENRVKDVGESTKDAQAELQAMDVLLNEPSLTPEAKEKVKAEREKIVIRLKRGELGIKMIEEKIATGKKVETKLSDEQKSAAAEMNSVSTYLTGQVIPAKTSLETNIANMEQLKLQYATEGTQVTEHYNKRVTEMDKISEGVNDYVFASAVSRNKSLDALKKSTDSLNSLTVERKSAWHMLNPGTYLEAVGQGFMAVAHWMDGNTNSVLRDLGDRFKETNSIWGKIGYGLAYGLTQVGGAFAGFVSGACELVGGVFNMAAHPLESLNGIGTLLGMNVKEGKFFDADTFKAAWTGLGKAVVGYDQFTGENQNYGGAVGKFAFNVMSMFVGAGEVGAVGKAGEAANLARVAEIDVALAKAGANVGKFEGVAAKLAALEKVDAALGSTLAKDAQFASRVAYVKTFAKTVVYESMPQFSKDALKAGGKAEGLLGKSWAVTKSLAGSGWEFAKTVPGAVKSGLKAAPKAVVSVYANLLMAPFTVMRGIGRMAQKLPQGWKAFRGEGLVNAYRAGKMSEAGKVLTAESGQYAKARTKVAEIIERDPELAQLAKEGEFGAAAAEGKARIKLMTEEPALFESYMKVKEATENLQSYSKKMAEDSMSAIEKVKKNPEVAYEVSELDRLKAKAAEAKTVHDQVTGTNPANAPKAKPQVVTDTSSVSHVDAFLDQTAGQKGWNPQQKAHMREVMLGSDELKNTAAGKQFARKMQDIAEPYMSGAQKFPAAPGAVPKISEAEAKLQLDKANKAVETFQNNPDRMKYVNQYDEAVAAEKNLKTSLEDQQKLFQEYLGARNPELAALEAEIGEVAAKRGETLGRPAIKDSPDVTKAHYDAFVDAAKTNDAAAIEKARAQFGPREGNTPLGKKLDAIEQIAKETPVAKAERAAKIKEFSDACKTNPDLAFVRGEYLKALKSGEVEVIERLKKAPISKPYADALAGLELEFRANPKNLHDVYMAHQDGLYNMYREYNQAWADGDVRELSEIRAAHPDLVKAFDELDFRHNMMDKNTAIMHDIAAARIRAELAGEAKGFKPTTKAQEAADELSKRYSNDKKQLGVAAVDKPVSTITLENEAGKAAQYKVVLKADGAVVLFDEVGNLVKTSAELKKDAALGKPAKAAKGAPAVSPTAKPGAAPTKTPAEVKVMEGDLAKLEKDLQAAKAKDTAVADLEAKVQAAQAELEIAKKAPSGAPSKVPSADELSKIKSAEAEWQTLKNRDSRRQRQQTDPGKMYRDTQLVIDGVTVDVPHGTTRYKNGTLEFPDGRLRMRDGTTIFRDGHIELPNGSVRLADGSFTGSKASGNVVALEQQQAAVQQKASGLKAEIEAQKQIEQAFKDVDTDYQRMLDRRNPSISQKVYMDGRVSYYDSAQANKYRGTRFPDGRIEFYRDKAIRHPDGRIEIPGKVRNSLAEDLTLNTNYTKAQAELAAVEANLKAARSGTVDIAKLEANLAQLEADLLKAKPAPGSPTAIALEADIAKLKKEIADAQATAVAPAATATPAAKPQAQPALSPDKVKALEEGIAKTEAELIAAREHPAYKAVNELEEQIAKARENLDKARAANDTGKVTSIATELSDLKQKSRAAQKAPEYAKIAQLESDLAKMQKELGAGKPIESAKVTPLDKEAPTATRVRQADSAIEAAKVDLKAEKAALRAAKEDLALKEQTYIQAKGTGKYSDAALENLKNKVEAARGKVSALEGKIESLDTLLSESRSEYRGALLRRGGEKLVDKLTSPLRSKWLESIKNKMLALPGIPKDIVLGLAGLLGQEGRYAVLATFKFFNKNSLGFKSFGQKLRLYLNEIIQSQNNSQNILKLVAPLANEQLIIMTQLSKARLPTQQEMTDFSNLSMPEKLAALEKGFDSLKEGTVNSKDFYNNSEMDYVHEKNGLLDSTMIDLSTQPNPTVDSVKSALDTRFGPAMNDMGKPYQINLDGITVNVAADGTRTYEGIEQWVGDAPKRALVGTAFGETTKTYTDINKAQLTKLNGGKPIDSVESYRRLLTDSLTEKIAGKLANQELSNGMSVYSSEKTPDGKPAYIARINEKGQIKIEINDGWSQDAYNAIQTKKGTGGGGPGGPGGQPSVAPRPKPAPVIEEPTTSPIEDLIPGNGGFVAPAPGQEVY